MKLLNIYALTSDGTKVEASADTVNAVPQGQIATKDQAGLFKIGEDTYQYYTQVVLSDSSQYVYVTTNEYNTDCKFSSTVKYECQDTSWTAELVECTDDNTKFQIKVSKTVDDVEYSGVINTYYQTDSKTWVKVNDKGEAYVEAKDVAIATKTQAGIVAPQDSFTVDNDGKMELNVANETTLGGIKVEPTEMGGDGVELTLVKFCTDNGNNGKHYNWLVLPKYDTIEENGVYFTTNEQKETQIGGCPQYTYSCVWVNGVRKYVDKWQMLEARNANDRYEIAINFVGDQNDYFLNDFTDISVEQITRYRLYSFETTDYQYGIKLIAGLNKEANNDQELSDYVTAVNDGKKYLKGDGLYHPTLKNYFDGNGYFDTWLCVFINNGFVWQLDNVSEYFGFANDSAPYLALKCEDQYFYLKEPDGDFVPDDGSFWDYSTYASHAKALGAGDPTPNRVILNDKQEPVVDMDALELTDKVKEIVNTMKASQSDTYGIVLPNDESFTCYNGDLYLNKADQTKLGGVKVEDKIPYKTVYAYYFTPSTDSTISSVFVISTKHEVEKNGGRYWYSSHNDEYIRFSRIVQKDGTRPTTDASTGDSDYHGFKVSWEAVTIESETYYQPHFYVGTDDFTLNDGSCYKEELKVRGTCTAKALTAGITIEILTTREEIDTNFFYGETNVLIADTYGVLARYKDASNITYGTEDADYLLAFSQTDMSQVEQYNGVWQYDKLGDNKENFYVVNENSEKITAPIAYNNGMNYIVKPTANRVLWENDVLVADVDTQSGIDEHAKQVATTEKLGHIKLHKDGVADYIAYTYDDTTNLSEVMTAVVTSDDNISRVTYKVYFKNKPDDCSEDYGYGWSTQPTGNELTTSISVGAGAVVTGLPSYSFEEHNGYYYLHMDMYGIDVYKTEGSAGSGTTDDTKAWIHLDTDNSAYVDKSEFAIDAATDQTLGTIKIGADGYAFTNETLGTTIVVKEYPNVRHSTQAEWTDSPTVLSITSTKYSIGTSANQVYYTIKKDDDTTNPGYYIDLVYYQSDGSSQNYTVTLDYQTEVKVQKGYVHLDDNKQAYVDTSINVATQDAIGSLKFGQDGYLIIDNNYNNIWVITDIEPYDNGGTQATWSSDKKPTVIACGGGLYYGHPVKVTTTVVDDTKTNKCYYIKFTYSYATRDQTYEDNILTIKSCTHRRGTVHNDGNNVGVVDLPDATTQTTGMVQYGVDGWKYYAYVDDVKLLEVTTTTKHSSIAASAIDDRPANAVCWKTAPTFEYITNPNSGYYIKNVEVVSVKVATITFYYIKVSWIQGMNGGSVYVIGTGSEEETFGNVTKSDYGQMKVDMDFLDDKIVAVMKQHTESWTFTLDDDSTITHNVCILDD